MANVKHHQLTAQKIKGLTKPGTYSDGETLTIRVSENGNKRWIQRISINGKQHNLGLGGYPTVGLAEARQRAQGNVRDVREGRDPLEEKRDAIQMAKKKNAISTFQQLAAEVIENKRRNEEDEASIERWERSLRNYAFPVIGNTRTDKITTNDVLKILTPIWSDKQDTSRRLRQRISNILDLAIAKGPASKSVTVALPKQNRMVENFKALPYAEVPSAINAIQNSSADLVTKLALEFTILTAARTKEIRYANWSQIDLEDRLRTIPAKAMKMRRNHRIPLSDRAVSILNEAQELSGGEGLIFPNERSRKKGNSLQLSSGAFIGLVKRLKIDAVPHGFRSSFKDWSIEKQMGSDMPSEFALAHVEGTKSKRAYARTDLVETRRGLMENWAHFCSTGETPTFQWEDSELQKLNILT